MKLYIAGPMRRRPGRNYAAFHTAAAYIRSIGHDPVDPAVRAERMGVLSDADLTEKLLYEALAEDFLDLLGCDGIVLLPEWEDSEGARVEETVARMTGKVRYRYRPELASSRMELLE